MFQFKHVPVLGALGFAFLYYLQTAEGRRMVPRSKAVNSVGMEGDAKTIRVFVPFLSRVRRVRRTYFYLTTHSSLSFKTAFTDGLARQRVIEEDENVNNEKLDAHPQAAFDSLNITKIMVIFHSCICLNFHSIQNLYRSE